MVFTTVHRLGHKNKSVVLLLDVFKYTGST